MKGAVSFEDPNVGVMKVPWASWADTCHVIGHGRSLLWVGKTPKRPVPHLVEGPREVQQLHMK